MAALKENDLRLFVDSVRRYFQVSTRIEPEITSAYLAVDELEGHEFNGIVSFSGGYNGHVIVSMPAGALKELLMLQQERDLSDAALLDAVGEVANTLAGNARKHFGPGLEISVPVRLQGRAGTQARVRRHPYVMTLRWNSYPATVWVDLEPTH